MFNAVFISDLHLHPDMPAITRRFEAFVSWALVNTRSLYILGDFWHVWAGDDTIDSFSSSIMNRIKQLVDAGIAVYFIAGNRDFLVGKTFLKRTGMTLLPDETVIALGKTRVLLAHGDGYCVDDKAHQWFRRLTRRPWFSRFFLALPKALRCKLVAGARSLSRGHLVMLNAIVIPSAIIVDALQHARVNTLIHGHIHQPGLIRHGTDFKQYVLSDWDDSPHLLCYDESEGLSFIHI